MHKPQNNFAFIDSQNLYRSTETLGWRVDYKKFRVYLKDKFGVTRAYLFLGYLPSQRKLYAFFRSVGYQLIFKRVTTIKAGILKGNVDAELVLQTMIDYPEYDQAVIVTNDGDFACLVRYLLQQRKLHALLATDQLLCSFLLKETAHDLLRYLSDIRVHIQK